MLTMKDYFIWEPIPKDWKANVKEGVAQDHPTHGWSKIEQAPGPA
jgi:hypothetical protein